MDNKTILIAAGGTGGHINPALSVAGLIRYLHPDCSIHFVGTADRLEAKLVPAAGYDFHTIEISGFQRGFSPEDIKRNLGTVKKLLVVTGQVNKLLNELKPDLVVGFGGYVSGPVLRAAAKAGIPTAIHESNAYPGMANRLLAKRVDSVMLTSETAAPRLRCKNEPIVTGVPVRRELLQAGRAQSRRELGMDESDARPMVLSMGGSLGAQAMNEAAVGMIERLWKNRDVFFHHGYGQYGKWVPETLHKAGVNINAPEITLREYIDDMARCMATADLVISRAGASTTSEILACGKPSVLIPSPNVTENHQYYNAKAIADRGAAVLIEEKGLTPQLLAKTVTELLGDPVRLAAMARAAKDMAITDAAERIYAVLRSLMN